MTGSRGGAAPLWGGALLLLSAVAIFGIVLRTSHDVETSTPPQPSPGERTPPDLQAPASVDEPDLELPQREGRRLELDPVPPTGAIPITEGPMPLERVLELAEAHFQPNDMRDETLRGGFGPWLSGLSRFRVSKTLAMKLTEAQFEEVLAMEAAFNRDLDGLATLYVEDYNHALHEVWVTKQWHIEEPIDPTRGTFRDALPGESVLEFPGRAIYYSVPFERYPHLKQHLDDRRELVTRRKREIVDWAVANRDEKWIPGPGAEQDFE